jgi:hypothetical protein
MLKTRCATIALFALGLPLANPALAADCAGPVDAAALKTAVMQQELMVAALQCHETGAYNRFVTTYQGELQSSDAALKAFFVRRGGEHGESGYDTFKTKAANLSALEQARDARAFCADAHALFTAALSHQGSLMSFVDARAGATNVGNICVVSRPVALPIKAEVKPVPAAPIRIAYTRPADVAVAGVPAFNEPAIPYRHADAPPPPPPAVARVADRDDVPQEPRAVAANADENDAPPPRPRYYQIRNQSYDNGYGNNGYGNYAPPPPPRNYGPPPGWQSGWAQNYYAAPPPPPGYGWYQRNGYYNW